jgi:hypothetical protein
MKIDNIILYGLLIVVIGVLFISITGLAKPKGITASAIASPGSLSDGSGFNTVSTGDTSPGSVSVDLTPHAVSNGQLKVDISVNTHSVSLDKIDLKKVTTLEYKGKSINPTSAPGLNGHHSSGELVFDVGEGIESFTIKINGIPKVENRIFTWGN